MRWLLRALKLQVCVFVSVTMCVVEVALSKTLSPVHARWL